MVPLSYCKIHGSKIVNDNSDSKGDQKNDSDSVCTYGQQQPTPDDQLCSTHKNLYIANLKEQKVWQQWSKKRGSSVAGVWQKRGR